MIIKRFQIFSLIKSLNLYVMKFKMNIFKMIILLISILYLNYFRNIKINLKKLKDYLLK